MSMRDKFELLKQHRGAVLAGELLLSAFLLAYDFGIDALPILSVPSFFERDLTHAHPFVEETISTGQLIGIAFFLPVLLMATIQAIYNFLYKRVSWTDNLISVAFVVLLVAQSHILAGSLYNTFKVTFGRLRPNFFAYCNYAGYRDALASGNFTEYYDATTFGAFGDISKCRASTHDIKSATSAFPSGHAGSAFAGLLILTLYLRSFFDIPKLHHVSLAAFVAAAPLMLASYVSLTRFRDRFHFTDDILAGALIGIGSAIVCWWHYNQTERDIFAKSEEAPPAADKQPAPSSLPPTRAAPGAAPYTASALPYPSQHPVYGGSRRNVSAYPVPQFSPGQVPPGVGAYRYPGPMSPGTGQGSPRAGTGLP